jgi:hypothetical protein
MTTKELVKQWTLQNVDSGRASNLSFQGRELISYKTVVARMHYNGAKGCGLFTTAYYSKTTTAHINRARTACSHVGNYHFIVPIIDPLTKKDHLENISHILKTTYTSELADAYKKFFLKEEIK